jgi:putative Holliday junction resolvase
LTYLGIDYGTRRIGLAAGEDDARVAFPLEAATQPSGPARLEHIAALVRERGVGAFVVGFPLNEDGSPSPMSARVDAFIAKLEKRFGLPVYRVDEYLSSQAADVLSASRKAPRGLRGQQAARRSGQRDSRAAALILQDYLNAL